MRKLCVVGLLVAALSAHAAGVKTGNERLRELVVEPAVNISFNFPQGESRADFLDDYLVPAEIAKLRKETKEHPDDPERLLELGTLVDRSDETNNGTEYYEQAEKAARKKSAMRPQDGPTLTCLGNALDYLGGDSEAESVFRKATMVSSNEWKCWVGLGKFLGKHALRGLVPQDYTNQNALSLDTLLSATATYTPPPDALSKSVAMRKESEQCFERAISLAPKEPDVYLARADIAQSFAIEDWLVHFYSDRRPPDANQQIELSCPAAHIQYLDQAARLCPDDYRVVGLALVQDCTLAGVRVVQQDPADANPPLGHLSEKTQAFVREMTAHLESLSQSADKVNAASAFQYLGMIKMFLKDNPGAKAEFRHSVTLEPANEGAWDLLLAVMEDAASPDELVDVCKARLKNMNSAQSHLLLAKALIKQNKFGDADNQLQQASELEPDSALPYLIAAASEIKSADERNLSAAADQMNRAKDRLGKMHDSEKKRELVRAYALDTVILCAILDQPAEAKDGLRQYLARYPDDQTAKDIMIAIE